MQVSEESRDGFRLTGVRQSRFGRRGADVCHGRGWGTEPRPSVRRQKDGSELARRNEETFVFTSHPGSRSRRVGWVESPVSRVQGLHGPTTPQWV